MAGSGSDRVFSVSISALLHKKRNVTLAQSVGSNNCRYSYASKNRYVFFFKRNKKSTKFEVEFRTFDESVRTKTDSNLQHWPRIQVVFPIFKNNLTTKSDFIFLNIGRNRNLGFLCYSFDHKNK